MIFQLHCSNHITYAPASSQWLRVPELIQLKIAVLAFEVFHGTVPRYSSPLVRVFDLDRRCLCSASTDRLVLPSFKLSTTGSRMFKVAAVRTWSALPEYVTTSPIRCPFFTKDLKSICFANLILTLFVNLTFHLPFEWL